MKRLFIVLLALSLLALPALAEAAQTGPFDYTKDILEDGSLIFYFEDLSLTLPVDWAGKLLVLPDENRVNFYQAASYEKYLEEGLEGGGFLFSLGASVNTGFAEDLPSFQYLGFSERSMMNYFLETPSDYPAWTEDADIRAEWDEMYAAITEFVVPNAAFYPAED